MFPAKYQYILLIIIIGAACFFFYDYILQIIVAGVIGGAELKRRANKAKSKADAHEEMMDSRLVDVARELEEAESERKESLDLAEEITEPNEKQPGTRKSFTIR